MGKNERGKVEEGCGKVKKRGPGFSTRRRLFVGAIFEPVPKEAVSLWPRRTFLFQPYTAEGFRLTEASRVLIFFGLFISGFEKGFDVIE